MSGGGAMGTDITGVVGTGSDAVSASGMDTGTGEVSGAGVGAGDGGGSGRGTTATSAGVSGGGMATDTRHACQLSDATARPTICSMKAASKAENNGVRITLRASFPT